MGMMGVTGVWVGLLVLGYAVGGVDCVDGVLRVQAEGDEGGHGRAGDALLCLCLGRLGPEPCHKHLGQAVLLYPHAGNLLPSLVSGGGIRRLVLHPWDMDNVELVVEGLFLEVEETWVGDVLQVPVALQ